MPEIKIMSKTNNRRLRARVRELEAMVKERESANAWKCYLGAAAKLNDLDIWGEELARIVYRLEPHQALTRTSFEDVTNEVKRLVETPAWDVFDARVASERDRAIALWDMLQAVAEATTIEDAHAIVGSRFGYGPMTPISKPEDIDA